MARLIKPRSCHRYFVHVRKHRTYRFRMMYKICINKVVLYVKEPKVGWNKIGSRYNIYCKACKETQPNQMAHMSDGGCLSDAPLYCYWLWTKKFDIMQRRFGIKKCEIKIFANHFIKQ
jgi:hypothetical protein